jgi:hypothetical protein
MHVRGDKLYSGSDDGFVRVWDIVHVRVRRTAPLSLPCGPRAKQA